MILYQASPDEGLLDWFISRTTLVLLFGTTLLYWIIVPAAMYLVYATRSLMGAIVLFVLLASPWWPVGYWPAFAHGFASWRTYFSLTVEGSNDSVDGTLYVGVPHGLFPMALPMMAGIWHDCFPRHKQTPRAAIATSLFYAPLMAPMLRWLGCIPATQEAIRATLQSGQSVFLLPDGIAGAFRSSREREVVYIMRRRGFLHLAHELQIPVVPVYFHGHTKLFDVLGGPARLSRWLGFSIIMYRNPLPYRAKVTVEFASPIMPQETVELTHAAYVQRIRLMEPNAILE